VRKLRAAWVAGHGLIGHVRDLRVIVLTPAEAGWGARTLPCPQSCDWGYRITPALRACGGGRVDGKKQGLRDSGLGA
jgi:hypothetical protein